MKTENIDFISGQFHARIQAMNDDYQKRIQEIATLQEQIEDLQDRNERLNAWTDSVEAQEEMIEKLKEMCLSELNDPHCIEKTIAVSDITDLFGWKIEKSTPKYSKAMSWKQLKKVLKEYKIPDDLYESIADLDGLERTQKACDWLETQEGKDYEITENPKNPEPLKMDDEEIEEPIPEDDPQTLLIKGVFEDGIINMAELGINKQYSDAMEFKLKNPKASYEDFLNQGGKKSPKKKAKSPKKIEPNFNKKIEDMNINHDRNIAEDYWICQHNRTSTQIVKKRAIETFKKILKDNGFDIEKIPESKWDKLPQGKNLIDVDAIRHSETPKNHNISLFFKEDSKGYEKNKVQGGRLIYRFSV
jgi:TolA-binding protein